MLEWIQSHKVLLGWLAAGSSVTFVATLVAVPWLVVRIPADYFTHRKRRLQARRSQHPIIRFAILVAKNVLGYLFVAAGLLMLVLPGQGIMTLLIGVMCLDFPGKYQLERKLVSYGPVFRSINWLRVRGHRAPLTLEFRRDDGRDSVGADAQSQ